MFNELRWEVIVRFVDIGGIVVHHCLNVLFIIVKQSPNIETIQLKLPYSYVLKFQAGLISFSFYIYICLD